jgi:hypothetical protein
MNRQHHILHASNSKHHRAAPRSESSHAWIGAGIASAFTVFSALLMTHSVASSDRASRSANIVHTATVERAGQAPVSTSEQALAADSDRSRDDASEPYTGLLFRPPHLERAGLGR